MANRAPPRSAVRRMGPHFIPHCAKVSSSPAKILYVLSSSCSQHVTTLNVQFSAQFSTPPDTHVPSNCIQHTACSSLKHSYIDNTATTCFDTIAREPQQVSVMCQEACTSSALTQRHIMNTLYYVYKPRIDRHSGALQLRLAPFSCL